MKLRGHINRHALLMYGNEDCSWMCMPLWVQDLPVIFVRSCCKSTLRMMTKMQYYLISQAMKVHGAFINHVRARKPCRHWGGMGTWLEHFQTENLTCGGPILTNSVINFSTVKYKIKLSMPLQFNFSSCMQMMLQSFNFLYLHHSEFHC